MLHLCLCGVSHLSHAHCILFLCSHGSPNSPGEAALFAHYETCSGRLFVALSGLPSSYCDCGFCHTNGCMRWACERDSMDALCILRELDLCLYDCSGDPALQPAAGGVFGGQPLSDARDRSPSARSASFPAALRQPPGVPPGAVPLHLPAPPLPSQCGVPCFSLVLSTGHREGYFVSKANPGSYLHSSLLFCC